MEWNANAVEISPTGFLGSLTNTAPPEGSEITCKNTSGAVNKC
jgi:hypothetical protein